MLILPIDFSKLSFSLSLLHKQRKYQRPLSPGRSRPSPPPREHHAEPWLHFPAGAPACPAPSSPCFSEGASPHCPHFWSSFLAIGLLLNVSQEPLCNKVAEVL